MAQRRGFGIQSPAVPSPAPRAAAHPASPAPAASPLSSSQLQPPAPAQAQSHPRPGRVGLRDGGASKPVKARSFERSTCWRVLRVLTFDCCGRG